MRALGLDVGSKTIGVAVSDETGLIASAREVLRRRGQALDAAAVLERVARLSAGTVVVGLPLELDGREGHRARRVRVFVRALERALAERAERESSQEPARTVAAERASEDARRSIEVVLWDERFSTSAAERTLLEADLSRARRRQKIDAVAAQFILQGWLDARQRTRGNA